MSGSSMRSFITRTDVLRVALGWGAFAALLALHPLLAPPVPGPLLVVALLVIIAVILVIAGLILAGVPEMFASRPD